MRIFSGMRRSVVYVFIGTINAPFAGFMWYVIFFSFWKLTDSKSLSNAFGIAAAIFLLAFFSFLAGWGLGGLRAYFEGRSDATHGIHDSISFDYPPKPIDTDGDLKDINAKDQQVADTIKAAGPVSVKRFPIENDMLEMAEIVREKFWNPERFDPSIPDSAPKQNMIMDFIRKQQPGISDANAKAIEKVACPIIR